MNRAVIAVLLCFAPVGPANDQRSTKETPPKKIVLVAGTKSLAFRAPAAIGPFANRSRSLTELEQNAWLAEQGAGGGANLQLSARQALLLTGLTPALTL
jgi:hypothetical protein